MAITYLGGASIGTALPLFSTTLGQALLSIADQLTALAQDVAQLEADLTALEGDKAALLSELSNPQGVLDAMLAQLAQGPAAYIAGINAAIQGLLSGLTLAGLTQALAAGPAAFLASLQAAIAEVTSKIADIQSRITAIVARVQALVARIEAMQGRIQALLATKVAFEATQGTLATGGVHLFHYAGNVDALAADVDSQLAGGLPGGAPSDLAQAFVVIATAGGAITALRQVFKVP